MAKKKRNSSTGALPPPLKPEDVAKAMSGSASAITAVQKEKPSPFLTGEENVAQINNTAQAFNSIMGGISDGRVSFSANVGRPDNEEELQLYKDNNRQIIQRNALANQIYELSAKQKNEQNELLDAMNKYLRGESVFADTGHQALRQTNPYDPGGMRYAGQYSPSPMPEAPKPESLDKMPAPIYNKAQVMVERQPVAPRGGGGGGKAPKPVDLMLPVVRPDGDKGDVKAKDMFPVGDWANSLEKKGAKAALRNLDDQLNAVKNTDNDIGQNADKIIYEHILAGVIKGDLPGARLHINGQKIRVGEAIEKTPDGQVRIKPNVGWYYPHEETWKNAKGEVVPRANLEQSKDFTNRTGEFSAKTQQLRDFLNKTLFNEGNPKGEAIYKFGFKQQNRDGEPLKDYKRTVVDLISVEQAAKAAGIKK